MQKSSRALPPTVRAVTRSVRNAVRGAYYAGSGFECPVCGQSSRRFLPYGGRDQARCPRCGSMERHRATWLYFKRRTDLLSGAPKRVLHVAPEQGYVGPLRRALGGGYVTADIEPGKAQLPLDICDNPFRDGYFDVILCSHVLEHVPDDRRAMREFCRVLSPKGWALLQVPMYQHPTEEDLNEKDPEERLRRFGHREHVRRYGPDFADRLRESGFTVELLQTPAWCSAEEITKMKLFANTTLCVCHRA